ncbi:hypothetical protein GCM10023149_50810 [Mucilaginibacter gynuensis]|uniref:NACHT domain-containing protein n=1 Tax=Mucilaginibacter gynuensis TaxID=1302236 RepID=A0ABP8HIJ3_9SPHI
MSMFLPHYFEALKTCVLETSGYENIAPCDCKVISLLILNKTKQRISETTLKRVYGFAYCKFKPSLFTIDVLAQYCGYKGWDDFCAKQENKQATKSSRNLTWDTLKHNADKITSFTLQALKNKSGIPYSQTIKRRFLNQHFEIFLEENYTATILSAPAGYGKTIALCHWIEERFELNAKTNNNDIILFFSSSALMNVFLSGRDINDWLLSLLGFSHEDNVALLLNEKQKQGGNFYLIIDGFDEHMFKTDQFQLLLNQVLDVFALYQSHKWFKMVLTMRSASWINYRHELNSSMAWFTGFAENDNDSINVPLFSIQEIGELSKKINPAVDSNVSLEVAEKFNHPLYFQFYYKNNKDNFSLNNIDHVCIYDLISTFILNKVYLGHYSAEKILLLNELINEIDFKNRTYAIDKLKVNAVLKQYSHAYQELLSVGFLRELNASSGIQYNTLIQFANKDFLEYTIAKKLLLANDYVFNSKLIRTINDLFDKDAIKLPVLKWCIIYAVKSDQQKSFKALTETNLTANQKADLLIFLAELFEKECLSVHAESAKSYGKHNCIKDIFDYFIGFEFIHPEYEKTLAILLKFDLTRVQQITAYTAIAINAVVKLDVNKLDWCLTKLKDYANEDLAKFVINPLNCLDAIYYYLKYGIFKKEYFSDVTAFYFNPPAEESLEHKSGNDLVLLMAVFSTSICNNAQKGLRFINAIKKCYKDEGDSTSGYGFILSAMTADRCFLAGKIDEGLKIYNTMVQVHAKNEHAFTPFMKVMYHTLKIKAAIFTNRIQTTVDELKYIQQVAEQLNYKTTRVYILAYLIKHEQLLSPQVHKKVNYDFTKAVRESGLRAEIFLNQNVETSSYVTVNR